VFQKQMYLDTRESDLQTLQVKHLAGLNFGGFWYNALCGLGFGLHSKVTCRLRQSPMATKNYAAFVRSWVL